MQFSKYEDFYKEDIFSLGFLLMEKFEKREKLQELYDFDSCIFNYSKLNQIIDRIMTSISDIKIRNFLDFLKKNVFIPKSERIGLNEAYEIILKIQQNDYK